MHDESTLPIHFLGIRTRDFVRLRDAGFPVVDPKDHFRLGQFFPFIFLLPCLQGLAEAAGGDQVLENAFLKELLAILLGKGECGRRILVLALVEVPANKPFGLAIAGVELAVGVPANPLTGGELFRGCDEEEQQGVELIDVLTDADSDPSFAGHLKCDLLTRLALRDRFIKLVRRLQLSKLIVYYSIKNNDIIKIDLNEIYIKLRKLYIYLLMKIIDIFHYLILYILYN